MGQELIFCVTLISLHHVHLCAAWERNYFLCADQEHCYHNQSSLCESSSSSIKSRSCDDQLKLSRDSEGTCLFERISSECDLDTPSRTSPWDSLLFRLSIYRQSTWMSKRTAFNISFPSPAWRELEFRFEIIHFDKTPICRRFTLSNVSLPLLDTLYWDCPFFSVPENSSEQRYQLAVVNGEGEGGSYRFIMPRESRINPLDTPLHDWHVFFFYHLDYLYRSPEVPVTLQTVPHKFGRVSYNVSLVKCVDGDEECRERAVLASKLVTPPENATEATVLLPVWNNIAVYAFTVQVVSGKCTHGNAESCFLAISPVYVVEFSSLAIWSCIVFGVILCFSLVFFITLHRRIKQKRSLLMKLKEKPRKVLLIYLPETVESLEMVKAMASFLRECCYIHPFMVDTEVGCQDPKKWIRSHFEAAECILFLVPGQLDAESITPIRGQWKYAKSFAVGKYDDFSNVAAVTFPFSAEVPDELPCSSRFSVPRQMDQLLTWIHGGTWLDRKLLWGPQITSPSIGDKDRWHKVIVSVKEATKAYQIFVNHLKSLECKSTFISIPNGMMENSEDDKVSVSDGSKSFLACEDSDETDEDPFDPQIPDVGTLLAGQDGPPRPTSSLTSSSESLDEMDERLFVL